MHRFCLQASSTLARRNDRGTYLHVSAPLLDTQYQLRYSWFATLLNRIATWWALRLGGIGCLRCIKAVAVAGICADRGIVQSNPWTMASPIFCKYSLIIWLLVLPLWCFQHNVHKHLHFASFSVIIFSVSLNTPAMLIVEAGKLLDCRKRGHTTAVGVEFRQPAVMKLAFPYWTTTTR